jgi:septum formation protein
VLETARQKAIDVYKAEADSDVEPVLVLAADTIVVSDSIILEKPRGFDHHVSMLKLLRDSPRPHKVYTAVAAIVPLEVPVSPGYTLETCIEESIVHFKKDVTDDQILEYVKSGEASDAAGGYKVQEQGGKLLVDKVEGDYHNVIGLPVDATVTLIHKALDRARSATDDEDDDDDYDHEHDYVAV